MNFHFDVSALVKTLPMVGLGMLGIFAVILVIWGFVAVLNRVMAKSK